MLKQIRGVFGLMLLSLVALSGMNGGAHAEKRVALVIVER